MKYIFPNFSDNFIITTGTTWLVDKVIDYAALILLVKSANQSLVTILSSQAGFAIMRGELAAERLPAEVKRVLLYPIIVSGVHWVLCVANLEKRTFSVLDPYGPSSTYTDRDEVFQKFLNFIRKEDVKKKLKLTNRGNWTSTRYVYETQKDGNSCGVFVISFIESILNDIDSTYIIGRLEPVSYRHIIKKMILDSSENIINMCFCGRTVLANTQQSAKCSSCARSKCGHCVGLEEAGLEEAFVDGQCSLCAEKICFYCKSVVAVGSKRTCELCGRILCGFCFDHNSNVLKEHEICVCIIKQNQESSYH